MRWVWRPKQFLKWFGKMHVCTYIKGLVYCCPYFGSLFHLLINFKSPLGSSQSPKRAWFSCHLIHLSQYLLCSTNPLQTPAQWGHPHTQQLCNIFTPTRTLHPVNPAPPSSYPQLWASAPQVVKGGEGSQVSQLPLLASWGKHLRSVFSSSPSSQMRWWRGRGVVRTKTDRTGRKISLGFQWVSVLPRHGKSWGTALPPQPEPPKEGSRVVEGCGKGLSWEGENGVQY